MVNCPVPYCPYTHEDSAYIMQHMVEAHYNLALMLITGASIFCPELLDDDIFYMVRLQDILSSQDIQDAIQDMDQMDNQNELMHISIIDIDKVAPKQNEEQEQEQAHECPICLEENCTSLRKINICGHIYCATCIERWFKYTATCPICRIQVQTVS